MPALPQVVVLDADLPMKHALTALASHAAATLPVWDSSQQRFVDVFSCTDLVDIALFTHRMSGANETEPSGEGQQTLERTHLRDLHGLKRSKAPGFMMASVDETMLHGCMLLKQHGLECLPLAETASSGSVLHVLLPDQVHRERTWGREWGPWEGLEPNGRLT